MSYDQGDSDFATVAKVELERAGYGVWIDRFKIRAGDDWRDEIDAGLTGSTALLAVMSPEAAQSAYVTYEWAFALGSGMPVIPLVIRPTTMHLRLEALQYLDFSNPRNRPWQELLELLELSASSSPRARPRSERGTLSVIDKATIALESLNPDERWLALEALGQADDPKVTAILANLLQHPLREVRVYAATVVVNWDQEAALPVLIEGLRFP